MSNKSSNKEEEKLLTSIQKVERRVCRHMNEDHQTSLLAYARFYSSLVHATMPIKMTQMTPEGFILDVTVRNSDGTTGLRKEVLVKYPSGRMTKASQAHLLAHQLTAELLPAIVLELTCISKSFTLSAIVLFLSASDAFCDFDDVKS